MHCTLLDSVNSLHDSVTTTVLVCISAIIDMYIYIYNICDWIDWPAHFQVSKDTIAYDRSGRRLRGTRS